MWSSCVQRRVARAGVVRETPSSESADITSACIHRVCGKSAYVCSCDFVQVTFVYIAALRDREATEEQERKNTEEDFDNPERGCGLAVSAAVIAIATPPVQQLVIAMLAAIGHSLTTLVLTLEQTITAKFIASFVCWCGALGVQSLVGLAIVEIALGMCVAGAATVAVIVCVSCIFGLIGSAATAGGLIASVCIALGPQAFSSFCRGANTVVRWWRKLFRWSRKVQGAVQSCMRSGVGTPVKSTRKRRKRRNAKQTSTSRAKHLFWNLLLAIAIGDCYNPMFALFVLWLPCLRFCRSCVQKRHTHHDYQCGCCPTTERTSTPLFNGNITMCWDGRNHCDCGKMITCGASWEQHVSGQHHREWESAHWPKTCGCGASCNSEKSWFSHSKGQGHIHWLDNPSYNWCGCSASVASFDHSETPPDPVPCSVCACVTSCSASDWCASKPWTTKPAQCEEI